MNYREFRIIVCLLTTFSSGSTAALTNEDMAVAGICVASPAIIYAGEKFVDRFTFMGAKLIVEGLGELRKGVAGPVSAFTLGCLASKVIGVKASFLIRYLAGGAVGSVVFGKCIGRLNVKTSKLAKFFRLKTESRKKKLTYGSYLVAAFTAGVAIGLALASDRVWREAKVRREQEQAAANKAQWKAFAARQKAYDRTLLAEKRSEVCRKAAVIDVLLSDAYEAARTDMPFSYIFGDRYRWEKPGEKRSLIRSLVSEAVNELMDECEDFTMVQRPHVAGSSGRACEANRPPRPGCFALPPDHAGAVVDSATKLSKVQILTSRLLSDFGSCHDSLEGPFSVNSMRFRIGRILSDMDESGDKLDLHRKELKVAIKEAALEVLRVLKKVENDEHTFCDEEFVREYHRTGLNAEDLEFLRQLSTPSSGLTLHKFAHHVFAHDTIEHAEYQQLLRSAEHCVSHFDIAVFNRLLKSYASLFTILSWKSGLISGRIIRSNGPAPIFWIHR